MSTSRPCGRSCRSWRWRCSSSGSAGGRSGGRLVGIAWCSPDGHLQHPTKLFPKDVTCERAAEVAAAKDPELKIEGGSVHVSVHPIAAEEGLAGKLVLMHDLSFIERRS